jgi:hypothetical protein
MAETAILRAMADNAAAKERIAAPVGPFSQGVPPTLPVRPKARRIDFPVEAVRSKIKFSSFVKLPGASRKPESDSGAGGKKSKVFGVRPWRWTGSRGVHASG